MTFTPFKLFKNKRLAGLGGRGTNLFNVCVTLGTDATWYGCDGVFGAVTPDATLTNQTFYSLKWKAGGTFVMQFGVAGNEQVPNVPQIILYIESQVAPVIVTWDEANGYYSGIDIALATLLIAEQTGGATKICFNAEIEPVLFIHYDYNLETA